MRQYVREKFLPVVAGTSRTGRCRTTIGTGARAARAAGHAPEGYGCAGASATAYGLTCLELEAGDSGLRSFCSVQGSLAMFAIHRWGSEEQKEKWLPGMAAGTTIGCFGLTEPDAGSNPAAMRTRAKKVGDGWVLNGSKMWITNGSLADVAVVWARTEDGKVNGFLVEKGMPGFSAPVMHGKLSLRACVTCELVLDGVEVPEENRLTEANSLRAPLSCLNEARFGIVLGAAGAARACYEAALDYAKSRVQFDKPIAGYQLTQAKLVEMAVKVGQSTLLAMHLGRLKDAGPLRHRAGLLRQVPQRDRRDGGRPLRPHGARRQRHHARVSGPAPRQQPRVRAHLRGHARDAHADPRQRHHGHPRVHLDTYGTAVTGL